MYDQWMEILKVALISCTVFAALILFLKIISPKDEDE
jgi:hypothetical protein